MISHLTNAERWNECAERGLLLRGYAYAFLHFLQLILTRQRSAQGLYLRRARLPWCGAARGTEES